MELNFEDFVDNTLMLLLFDNREYIRRKEGHWKELVDDVTVFPGRIGRKSKQYWNSFFFNLPTLFLLSVIVS